MDRTPESLPLEPPGVSPRLACGVLTVVTVAALFRLCFAEFSGWDDEQQLALNPILVNASWQTLGHYWTHEHFALYLPVTGTVWAAMAWLGKLNPHLFHTVNLIVHLATVCVAFATLRRLLNSAWMALAGTMVFAVHPVQVETVGWASGLKDLLAGLGSIAAIGLYAAAVESPTRRRRLYAAAIGVFTLALLAKASAMTTAAIVLAIDLLWYRRPPKTALTWTAPWFVLAAVTAAVARALQPELQVAAEVPLWTRPLIAGHALSFYLGKLVWPAHLGFDYGQTPEFVLRTQWVYVAWIVPVAILIILAWLYRRGQRLPLVAAAIFILAPFHVLGWVPFDFQFYSTTADHYLYVAMLGVALAVGAFVGRLPWRVGVSVAVVIVAAMGVRSFVQTGVWQTTAAFVENGIRVNPNSFGFHGSLAVLANYRGDRKLALHHADRAVQIQPRYWHSYLDRGNIRLGLQNVDGAVADYRAAMQLTSEVPAVYINLGSALATQGKFDEAARYLAEGLEMDPTHADGLLHLGTIHMRRGQLDEAERLLGAGVAAHPANVRLRVRLARVLLATGRRDDADTHLAEARRLHPDNAELLETLRVLESMPR